MPLPIFTQLNPLETISTLETLQALPYPINMPPVFFPLVDTVPLVDTFEVLEVLEVLAILGLVPYPIN